uniref:C2H2-type domain-containing protein n=1 Tax=Dicentrarchus labrax TaxID=13489 RepID=A0A8C4H082_DICLA
TVIIISAADWMKLSDDEASAPPLSSLRLLVPPLRLLTAAMWQVARQQSVRHYGMLEDFVSLVTEAVPQLLTDRQRSLLLLALRAKVRVASLNSLQMLNLYDQIFKYSNVRATPLLCSCSSTFPTGADCLQEVDREDVTELLANQSCLLGRATSTGTGLKSRLFIILLSAWSHPLFTKLTNPEPPPADTEVQSDPVLQLDVELVKVEVVVMTEDEQEDVEEAVIGRAASPVEQEASNESSAVEIFSPCCLQVIRHLRTNKSCGSALTATGALNLQLLPAGQEEEPRPPEPLLPEPRPSRTHSCFQCNAIFRTKAELLSHQRSHRARPVYQCGQCDKEFHHLSSLTNHKQTHLDKGGFTCSRCDKVFESAKERDAHRLQHRLPDLTCTVCDQTFSSQTQLLRHLQTHSVEGAEPCYNCRFCDQTFSGNFLQLRIHQRTHTFRSYQCDQCSKTYGSLTGLHSHRASHTAESRFLCPQCGKRFKTRDGLEGHLRTHTGERPYRCPYCPKDFTALAGLNVHVRRHTGERPYVCTVCGKGWPSGGDLQKHMRTHTGERPYVCQDCGKAFSISCHLTEHRRIHTGETQGASSGTRVPMKNHTTNCLLYNIRNVLTVLSLNLSCLSVCRPGEKPFSCPECGKCLRRKFDLKKHMLSHSSVRPYACVYCPKSYTRKTHLNRHLLTHRAPNHEPAAAEETADDA